MRRVHLGDVIAAARALAHCPAADRPQLADLLIRQADAAHRYMKRMGRPHPMWGNGSLESRAGGLGFAQGLDLGQSAHLAAMAQVASALAARKMGLALLQSPPM